MTTVEYPEGLRAGQRRLKRAFDIIFSLLGLTATGGVIVAAWCIATLDTRANGFFMQTRIGRQGKPFKVIKIRTMRDIAGNTTTVTASNDSRITRVGRILRKTKIDELPQLINVLLGQMSFVGPRPDVPGYCDQLREKDRIVLSVRPGITGPATLKYRNEEELLANQEDPETYNRKVIFPDKVKINREYVETYTFMKDIGYLLQTISRAGIRPTGREHSYEK